MRAVSRAFDIQGTMFEIIAETGERFSDFRPYVPSINDEGVVAFQATLTDGSTGVFLGDGEELTPVALPDRVRRVVSHPDLNGSGDLCFYADLKDGRQGVVLARSDGSVSISGHDRMPLGPTVNEAGTVAFRTSSGIFTLDASGTRVIAQTGERFESFDGLPVLGRAGAVAFRANLKGGGQAICLHEGGSLTTVADTRGSFDELGRFPVVDDRNRIAFCATVEGRPALFAAERGSLRRLDAPDAPFESYRGLLIEGGFVFYGTPRGHPIGIFTGPDPDHDRLFGIGDRLHGSAVAAFALNPVSMNRAGQLAIRVELESSAQLIVRLRPPGP